MKRPERKAEEQSLMIRDGMFAILAKKIAAVGCTTIYTNMMSKLGYLPRHEPSML